MNIRDLCKNVKESKTPDAVKKSMLELFPSIVSLGDRSKFGFKLFHMYLCDEDMFIRCNREIFDYYGKTSKTKPVIDGKINYRSGVVKRRLNEALLMYIGDRPTSKGARPLFLSARKLEDGVMQINGFETCMMDELDSERFSNAKCFGAAKNVKEILFMDELLENLQRIEKSARSLVEW